MRTRYSLALAGAVLATATAAQAAYLTNGDFEALSGSTGVQTFGNWSEAGDVAVVATTGLSLQSAKMKHSGSTSVDNRLYQNALDPQGQLAQFVVDLDFASSDPGGATNRSFHINLRPVAGNPAAGQINLRVVDLDADGDGDFEAYNGSAWVSVLKDAVSFSASEANPVSNHLKIAGDFASKVYTLTVNTAEAQNLTYFHGTVAANSKLQQVSFETGNLTSGAFYVIDNVSLVPEPAALGLIGVGSVLAMRRRRA